MVKSVSYTYDKKILIDMDPSHKIDNWEFLYDVRALGGSKFRYKHRYVVNNVKCWKICTRDEFPEEFKAYLLLLGV